MKRRNNRKKKKNEKKNSLSFIEMRLNAEGVDQKWFFKSGKRTNEKTRANYMHDGTENIERFFFSLLFLYIVRVSIVLCVWVYLFVGAFLPFSLANCFGKMYLPKLLERIKIDFGIFEYLSFHDEMFDSIYVCKIREIDKGRKREKKKEWIEKKNQSRISHQSELQQIIYKFMACSQRNGY